MNTQGLRQGRKEALFKAIEIVRDLVDDSKPPDWNAALKAVDDKLDHMFAGRGDPSHGMQVARVVPDRPEQSLNA
jgi:hypothetical protein